MVIHYPPVERGATNNKNTTTKITTITTTTTKDVWTDLLHWVPSHFWPTSSHWGRDGSALQGEGGEGGGIVLIINKEQ